LIGRAADAKLQFLAVYEPAAGALEEHYSNVTIRALCRREGWAAYEETGGKRVTRVLIRRRGPYVRVDETLLVEEGPRLLEKGFTVRTFGPKGAFRAFREASESGFQLAALYDDRGGVFTDAIFGEYKFMLAPFGLVGFPIRQFVGQPLVNVKGMRELTVNGERLVEVSWEDAEGSEYKGTGWWRFAPDRGWIVREFAAWAKDMTPEKLRTDPNYSIQRGSVEYDEDGDEIPIMRRVSYWREREPGRRLHTETIDIEELVFGEVPEYDFTLAALGIPEPRVETHTGRFLLLFAAGVISLIIAIGLWRRFKARPAQ